MSKKKDIAEKLLKPGHFETDTARASRDIEQAAKTLNADSAHAANGRMRVAVAAQYIGMSESTLNTMRSQGRGPRYMRLGNRIFYRIADLDAYLESCIVETEDSRD